jgi:ubiquinone/menaquinone biosynthesis C-methylase UbiE
MTQTLHSPTTAAWTQPDLQARYLWASRWVQNARVLHANCGTGEGTALLVQEGRPSKIDGIDSNPEALAQAAQRLEADWPVRLALGNVGKLPVREHAYDVYVSFETIEQVIDARALLDEAVRVIRPGGRFLCSTPNREVVHPGASIVDRPSQRHRRREYDFEEFRSFLRPYFSSIQWFGQGCYSDWYCQTLQLAGRLTSLAPQLHRVRKACSGWRSWESHLPQPIDRSRRPEVLIAVGTL